LAHRGAHPKVLPLFIKSAAEAGCCIDVPQPAHRVIALFDAAVILFKSIVELRAGTVDDVLAQRFADSTGIRGMAIRRSPVCSVAHCLNCLVEARLGAIQIPVLAETSTRLPSRSMARYRYFHPPEPWMSVSATYQERPACPVRLLRSWSVISGAKRASHSRPAADVNVNPRSRNSSARSRRLSVSRRRPTTTSRTLSGGTSR
jgi:hypothetical protein